MRFPNKHVISSAQSVGGMRLDPFIGFNWIVQKAAVSLALYKVQTFDDNIGWNVASLQACLSSWAMKIISRRIVDAFESQRTQSAARKNKMAGCKCSRGSGLAYLYRTQVLYWMWKTLFLHMSLCHVVVHVACGVFSWSCWKTSRCSHSNVAAIPMHSILYTGYWILTVYWK